MTNAKSTQQMEWGTHRAISHQVVYQQFSSTNIQSVILLQSSNAVIFFGVELFVCFSKFFIKMKLYAVSDGPPSLACRMVLKAINVPFDLVPVNFNIGEHLTDKYFKLNPQKEIPVLDDNGFLLSESIAIMQYLCDQYAPESPLYPKEPKKRALVNHRMCFNMGFYYNYISQYAMAPIFFDYPMLRGEMGKKKVEIALNAFETYLKTTNTKYAAGDSVTIADIALAAGTLPLEAIGYKFDHYPLVTKWYKTFKTENPDLWEIGQAGVDEIAEFEQNPPDLSKLNHPLHPPRKN